MTEPLVIAGLVLAADRYSKAAVSQRLCSGRVLCMGSCLRVRYVLTRFRRRGFWHGPLLLVSIWMAAAAMLAIAAHSGLFFRTPAAQMGLAAALAGSASNLYDRVRRGATVDFLDLGWWPTFNFADIAIVAGGAAALCFA